MANYCSNRLEFESADDLQRFLPLVKGKGRTEGSEYTYQVLAPIPEYVCWDPCPSTHLDDPKWWPYWVERRWGTKWDMCNCSISDDGTKFDWTSAWNPPVPWLSRLAKKLDGMRVIFHYSVEGDCGHGQCVIENGLRYTFEPDYEFDEEANPPWDEEEEEE